MNFLDQRPLGIVILLLLAMLVMVKRLSTGSILDRPQGGPLLQLVNAFNLFFLLVVNPLAAIALITRSLPAIDPTHAAIAGPMRRVAEISGLALYVAGFFLMAWALIALGKNYQLGGCAPRQDDQLIASGPYRLIRNPMYSAALGIALGLSFLLQSLAFFAVFAIYLLLILLLLPMEEEGLRKKYGAAYAAYRGKTKKLVPFLF